MYDLPRGLCLCVPTPPHPRSPQRDLSIDRTQTSFFIPNPLPISYPKDPSPVSCTPRDSVWCSHLNPLTPIKSYWLWIHEFLLDIFYFDFSLCSRSNTFRFDDFCTFQNIITTWYLSSPSWPESYVQLVRRRVSHVSSQLPSSLRRPLRLLNKSLLSSSLDLLPSLSLLLSVNLNSHGVSTNQGRF